jgi:hypothetical protein
MSFEITTVGQLPAELAAAAGSPLTDNFDLYARHASRKTELFWAVAEQAGRPVAAAPVVRLSKRPATEVLRPELRRWLGWLGPLARKTTLLVDTSFLAYDAASPWVCGEPDLLPAARGALCTWLRQARGADAVWITEPAEAAAWAAGSGCLQFHTLPMVHTRTQGYANVEEFQAGLSKKRRRNARSERERFVAAGGAIESCEGPLDASGAMVKQLAECLQASAARSELTVPYNDVMIDPRAFAAQPQTILIARVRGQVAGFMSFLQDGARLMQCHGGLDYAASHDALAYHNLIAAAIEAAIERGCELLSMGPLNNETKRRAGTDLRPMVACLWNRQAADRWVAGRFFARNFQVYRGPYPA